MTLVTGELFSERLPLSFDPRILFSNQSVDRIFSVGEKSIGSLDLNRPDSSTTRNYTTEGDEIFVTKVLFELLRIESYKKKTRCLNTQINHML